MQRSGKRGQSLEGQPGEARIWGASRGHREGSAGVLFSGQRQGLWAHAGLGGSSSGAGGGSLLLASVLSVPWSVAIGCRSIRGQLGRDGNSSRDKGGLNLAVKCALRICPARTPALTSAVYGSSEFRDLVHLSREGRAYDCRLALSLRAEPCTKSTCGSCLLSNSHSKPTHLSRNSIYSSL